MTFFYRITHHHLLPDHSCPLFLFTNLTPHPSQRLSFCYFSLFWPTFSLLYSLLLLHFGFFLHSFVYSCQTKQAAAPLWQFYCIFNHNEPLWPPRIQMWTVLSLIFIQLESVTFENDLIRQNNIMTKISTEGFFKYSSRWASNLSWIRKDK